MLYRLFATVAFVATVGLAPLTGQAVELTYNTYMAPTHVVVKLGVVPFAERVARESGGEVSFKLLTGGAVAKPSAGLDVMRDGIVNSGMVVDIYTRKSLPLNTVISDLALLGTDPLVMVGAVSEFKLIQCKECIREMSRASSIAMAFSSTTPYTLMCKPRVDSLASMANTKVRATGPWGVMFKELGMVPVNVSSSEIYEAMQRGQIACTAGAEAWLRSYTLWDVVRYVVDYPMGTYHGNVMLGMNAESWKSLSDRARDVILRNIPEMVADAAYGYIAEREEARAEATDKGISIVPATQDLVDAIEAYKQKEIERVIVQAENAGIPDARAEVQTFLATLDKWQKIVDDGKRDRAAYIQALDREIYSKVVFE